MSKHLIDKINRFYMAESNRDVLKMMSGFIEEEGEQYFIPRSHVKIPFLQNREYVTHVFPHYVRWLKEYNSDKGDKDQSAQNFLLCTIPYLARVVIQDAPHHLKKYPNSAFSRFFRSNLCMKFPEYAEFCKSALGEAHKISELANSEETRDLNPAAQ